MNRIIEALNNKLKTQLLRKKHVSEDAKTHMIIGDSIDKGICLRLHNPEIGRIYLTIGDDCIVAGNFVFESDQGKIDIGNHTHIGGSTFVSHSHIIIGNNVMISWGGGAVCDHDSHSLNYMDRRKDIDDELEANRNDRNPFHSKDWTKVNSKPIKICDDAWIGMNVIILKGVTIGRGAIVAAGSVVTKDVPEWTVVAGNPAVVVKQLTREL